MAIVITPVMATPGGEIAHHCPRLQLLVGSAVQNTVILLYSHQQNNEQLWVKVQQIYSYGTSRGATRGHINRKISPLFLLDVWKIDKF